MCVIALVPAGEELTKDQFKAMWDTNPDGGGFGWCDRHDQWRIKTFMDFSEMWNAYKGTIQGYRDRDFLVHFRIGTHGFKDLSNVHPFRVDHNTIMAHNGVISCVPDYQDGRSDTRVFVEDTLPRLPKGWLDVPELRWLVEEAIGSSKLVFLTNDPTLSAQTYIFNKRAGTELENGIWVSNKLWEKKQTSYQSKVVAFNKPSTSYPGGYQTKKDEEIWEGALNEGWVPAGTTGKQIWRPKPELAAVASAVSTNGDVFKLKEMIEDRRRTDGLNHEISMIDGVWTCLGCFEAIDDNADCECFNSACLQCYDYCAYCECSFDVRYPLLIDDILATPEKYQMELISLSHLQEFADALADLDAIEDAEVISIMEGRQF